MAKTRAQKEEILEKISQNLKGKKSVIVGYSGLAVKEMEKLRNSLEEKGVGFFVVKNTLVKIALKGEKITIDDEILEKPIAMAFSNDEVASAKEIKNFSKEHEKLEIYGGIIENQFVPTSTISALALLPSREELIAKIVGTIAAPLSGFVNVLSGNIRGLVSVLNQYQLSKK
ncbi:MAG: large subunit ribosomal protein L10 [Candidatus Berkelbacteria bacterium Athens1014_28]|uniref:Large ribosomal subunit protein uL10 n=1 Tax=Candidatus Berkelbacteria bacterium Athens1014_28 TaxID=2017145 RepID=A0A554LLT1_9BACT|nr:MAG: large subunit ribosomal protein L10 [Candidatus Berkelbacteria bacterium Athens1014_28]